MDDTTGKPLEHSLAVQARKLEIEFFREMRVYEKAPRWKADEAGCRAITTRWLDIDEGDELKPIYRARLVGRELVHTHADTMFCQFHRYAHRFHNDIITFRVY